MNIETLFEKSDFHSIVFQKYLLTTGQISTETIFSAPQFRTDISFIKDKIFVFLLKPLLDICDCYIRVDNFYSMTVNFVLVLKESVLPEILAVNIKQGSRAMNLSNLTVQLVKKYQNDIHKHNIKKCMEFLRSGAIVTTPDDFYEDISSKAKILCPFAAQKINLDLFNIARIMTPQWSKYIKDVYVDAKRAIQEEVKKQATECDSIFQSINEGQLYWDDDAQSFPRYPDLISRIIYDVKNRSDIDISPETVRNVIMTSDKFFMFRVTKNEIEPPEIRASIGQVHYVVRKINDQISILENGEQIKILSTKKTSFLTKHIKSLVLPHREVFVDNSYKSGSADESVFVIFLSKASEIVSKAIYSQRYKNLKIVQELFRFAEFSEQKILFDSVNQTMANAIETIIVNKKIIDFLKEFEKSQSFWYKIINSFFSAWNQRELENQLSDEQTKITNVSDNILKLNQSNNEEKIMPSKQKSDYDPVKTVINMISQDLRAKEIRQILADKNLSLDVKTSHILNLYEDIGATSKAVISKNEKLQNEFISKVKSLVKK